MTWLEHQYVALASHRLLKFKRKSPVLYNFRCPVCLDSSKNKNKARGYIYEKKGDLYFSCHNCGINWPFGKFLKELDGGLYDQYKLDRIKESNNLPVTPDPIVKMKPLDKGVLDGLQCLVDLPNRHKAVRYVESRCIPEKFYPELYYCDAFKAFTNSVYPNKFESLDYDEDRLVMPFFDRGGSLFGYQGRSFDPESKIRYISIILDESKPKFWGLNRVDMNRPYYITEGPIDAMMLNNAIASCGGKISPQLNLDNAVILYDNEPRNEAVAANVRKAMAANYQIVIWPPNHRYKDINEMVLAGWKFEQIESLLKSRTFKGLNAQLEYSQWKT